MADWLNETASNKIEAIIRGFTNSFDCMVIFFRVSKIGYSIIDRGRRTGFNRNKKSHSARGETALSVIVYLLSERLSHGHKKR